MPQQDFHDQLVAPGTTNLPERFFDRFMFNLHPADATAPSVIMGLGHYPGADVADGFAITSTESEQRNVRFSTELSATDGRGAGPLSFEVLEPNQTWRLRLGRNPTGMESDLTWQARTPYWVGDVTVTNTDGPQRGSSTSCNPAATPAPSRSTGSSGRSTAGTASVTAPAESETMSGGQGLHIWYQAQFPDRSVGFLLVEDREGGRLLLEGSVMHEDGTLDDVVGVRHDLQFAALDLKSGTVEVTTAGGTVYTIETDASAGGGLMAGAGYGGHHGKALGRDHIEADVYPLDGTVTQLTLVAHRPARRVQLERHVGPGHFRVRTDSEQVLHVPADARWLES